MFQYPDFETRIAIIKRKAELLEFHLPDQVAEYIANKLKNNIRQLEGAVKKVQAYCLLDGAPPVLKLHRQLSAILSIMISLHQ